jgi:FkbH-like protein
MTMKLAEAIKTVRAAPQDAKPLEVALVCGFTPLHLETFLRAELCKLFPERLPRVTTGLYGDLAGNLQRVSEGQVEQASAVVVIIEWADLDPRLDLRRLGNWEPSQLPDILSQASQRCEVLERNIEAAAERLPVVLSLPSLPLPPIAFTPRARASEFSLQLQARVATMAASARFPAVKIANSQRIDKLSPPPCLDVNAYLLSGFPYTLSHASALAQVLAQLVLSPLPKKGLITDLDDTLWRGVLGEVGVEGVSWDMDHHSQIHGLYQQLLRSLATAGTLIGVASKNERQLVEQAFARKDLVLREKDVFPFQVHWDAKSQSVASILAAWNVAADDVVFVDDSALDLAEVKAAHPAITCLPFPKKNDQTAYELLEQLRDLFGKETIAHEDSLRSSSLRANFKLREAGNGAPSSAEDFLRHVEARLTLNLQKEPFDARALELVNKTNQFNLNGRRFQEAEWRNWLNRPDTVIITMSYEDKYGPLGKIAVVAGHLLNAEPNSKHLRIETWVMSCRAFSRLIEYQCLKQLFTTLNVAEIEFDFMPTPRNTPIRDFLERVCGATPDAKYQVSYARFAERCPVLSHAVQESQNG